MEQACELGEKISNFQHASHAGFTTGLGATIRAKLVSAALAQDFTIVLGGNIVPHNTVHGRGKSDGRMAILASLSAYDMPRVLTWCGDSVVTTGASAEDLEVIDLCDRREGDDGVAVLANGGGRNMIDRLANRFDAVVATSAIASKNPGNAG